MLFFICHCAFDDQVSISPDFILGHFDSFICLFFFSFGWKMIEVLHSDDRENGSCISHQSPNEVVQRQYSPGITLESQRRETLKGYR